MLGNARLAKGGSTDRIFRVDEGVVDGDDVYILMFDSVNDINT
jgi:hypothetical protein